MQIYKRVNVVYHFMLGLLIFCFNKHSFKGVPVSALIFFGELTYIVYLFKLQPYKQCLKIHSIGVIFNRAVFLAFLGFVTLKNLVAGINEVVMLGMCFLIVGSVFIMIVLSFIRLYYDLRFGEELEIKLEE